MNTSFKINPLKSPTYLNLLLSLENQDDIQILHREIQAKVQSPHVVEKSECVLPDYVEDISNLSVLSDYEVTGTPLPIDVEVITAEEICKKDITVIPKLEKPPSWTLEEQCYDPLSVKDARLYLNSCLRSDKVGELPILAVCDGQDSERTVLLGLHYDDTQFTRTIAYLLPPQNETTELTIEKMQSEHLKNAKHSREFHLKKSECFYLSGYDLSNCSDLRNVPINESLSIVKSVEGTNGKLANPQFKAKLQVIMGHNLSPLSAILEELSNVESINNILLANSEEREPTISKDFFTVDEILFQLSDILKPTSRTEKNVLRQHDVLDKIWLLLKHCKNPSDLRDCLEKFLAKLNEGVHVIVKTDTSVMSKLMRGILDCTIAPPFLSLRQSLELLVDLGLEKVKSDYFWHINKLHSLADEHLMRKWSEFCDQKTIKLVDGKFRINLNPRESMTDISQINKKLGFLKNVHSAVELMLSYKKHKLQDDFFEELCKDFIFDKENVTDFKTPRLCVYSSRLVSQSDSITTEILPSRWSFTFLSSAATTDVTTVFHFSEDPIFPQSLLQNDKDVVAGEAPIHVSMLVKINEKI